MLGIRSGIIVFSISLLLIMLFSILSSSLVGGGLTIGVGGGPYRGIESRAESDVVARLVARSAAL